ncbi:MAG: hypothetical protein LQ343_000997 [Gyalolechia ehrenbergii]|nr:MAG: hypothetical protein LQ343_000997 [Gyalolechia ehrenbergii]
MQPLARSDKFSFYIPREYSNAQESVVFLDERHTSSHAPPSSPELDYLKADTWMQHNWAADVLMDLNKQADNVVVDWDNEISYPKSTTTTSIVQAWKASDSLHEDVETRFNVLNG